MEAVLEVVVCRGDGLVGVVAPRVLALEGMGLVWEVAGRVVTVLVVVVVLVVVELAVAEWVEA